MASAERAGARVSATFMDTTGPATRVSGARRTPSASTLVSVSRLIPVGWNNHCE